ncbi:hypothetical protein B5P45_19590 [Phyllobacterium zundukense]|uniref:Uncharacterized protein n=2 Tax=Phyllobacterium zundukense TaxID=1867719 RepID=A0A2N9VUK1_9HYPH|nr:hypothetical protein B5P45_19590 [Phyllobacterium zundukense]
MAVRADNGQPRSYLVSSILSAKPTQNIFSPRYPIELTPSGPQSIPHRSTSSSGLTARQAPVRRASSLRSVTAGPTYVFRCPVCGKTVNRKSYDAAARPHKNKAGHDCYGSYLIYVKTTY